MPNKKIPTVPELEARIIRLETKTLIEATASNQPFPFASATWGDIISIQVPRGEWDVQGSMGWVSGATTGFNTISTGINETAAPDTTGIVGALTATSNEFSNTANGQVFTQVTPLVTIINDTDTPKTIYLKVRCESNANLLNSELDWKLRARKVNEA